MPALTFEAQALALAPEDDAAYSQVNEPPLWYSITRVSKKFFSFFKSIASLIHGNGFSDGGNTGSSPSCPQRRFAMKCIYCSHSAADKPRNPFGIVSRPYAASSSAAERN